MNIIRKAEGTMTEVTYTWLFKQVMNQNIFDNDKYWLNFNNYVHTVDLVVMCGQGRHSSAVNIPLSRRIKIDPQRIEYNWEIYVWKTTKTSRKSDLTPYFSAGSNSFSGLYKKIEKKRYFCEWWINRASVTWINGNKFYTQGSTSQTQEWNAHSLIVMTTWEVNRPLFNWMWLTEIKVKLAFTFV